jgi:hypothetical protein
MLVTRGRSDHRSICAVLDAPPRVRGSCCIRVPAKIVRDPDPALYSQQLMHAAGLPVTFNSPDLDTITIWPLRPLDNIAATIRNMSADASANRTRVDLSWSPWGIGLPRQPLASSFVDLPRAGSPGSQQTVTWPMPAVLKDAGRFAVFVKVVHPYDRDTTNNEGEQAIDGFQTSEGRSRTFIVPVRNPTSVLKTISLTPAPAVIAPWVLISPSVLTLNPGTQQNVMVQINVPASLPASPAGTLLSAIIDVLATMNGAYLGGVTFFVAVNA